VGRRVHPSDDRRRAVVVPQQGEIWWAEAEDKRRPVLVVTRSDAIPVLSRFIVAPITRTARAIPTEIELGPEQGLPAVCVASFDNLQPIRRGFLAGRLGRLGVEQSGEICRALSALADC
jgi:mRNA interferase MazF